LLTLHPVPKLGDHPFSDFVVYEKIHNQTELQDRTLNGASVAPELQILMAAMFITWSCKVMMGKVSSGIMFVPSLKKIGPLVSIIFIPVFVSGDG
jgi:uncharacterized membrane protein